MPRLAAEAGVTVPVRPLRRVARTLGYAGKRCRRRLAGKREAEAFGAMRQQLADWHAAEARGEVAGVYGDECRFSRLAPVPYAWQRRGAPAAPPPRRCRPSAKPVGRPCSASGSPVARGNR